MVKLALSLYKSCPEQSRRILAMTGLVHRRRDFIRRRRTRPSQTLIGAKGKANQLSLIGLIILAMTYSRPEGLPSAARA
jgi:hypothetical protein